MWGVGGSGWGNCGIHVSGAGIPVVVLIIQNTVDGQCNVRHITTTD